MTKVFRKTSVTFPVTIWLVQETGTIHIARRTDPAFNAELTPGPCDQSTYDTLYAALKGAVEAPAPLEGVHIN